MPYLFSTLEPVSSSQTTMKLSSISLIAAGLAAIAGSVIAAPGPFYSREIDGEPIDDLFKRQPYPNPPSNHKVNAWLANTGAHHSATQASKYEAHPMGYWNVQAIHHGNEVARLGAPGEIHPDDAAKSIRTAKSTIRNADNFVRDRQAQHAAAAARRGQR